MIDDTQKIGIILLSFSAFFAAFGAFLFFDTALLALANLVFLPGLILLVGRQRAVAFFVDPQRRAAAVAFGAGVVLIFLRFAMIGFIVELLGFLQIFGPVLPAVFNSVLFFFKYCFRYVTDSRQ